MSFKFIFLKKCVPSKQICELALSTQNILHLLQITNQYFTFVTIDYLF